MSRSRTALRGLLLETSLRLFAVRGYRGTSLQDIATEAGCSKASLLYHFSSKEAILAELLAPAVAAAGELDARLAGVPDGRVAREAVTGFVDLALRHRREVALMLGQADEATRSPAFATSPAPDKRLLDALSGRSGRPVDELRALMVIGAVAVACASEPVLPAEEMREELVRSALRTLGIA